MGLHIVVCIKSTPSTVNVAVDSSTGQPKINDVPTAINPYDMYAVEEAVRLKERVAGSSVTVMTVGAESAAEALREALAQGCDEGILITGPEFSGGDSYAISLALSAGLKKLQAQKPVHLVLFGKNTSDLGTGVVGTQTAAWLDWSSASSIKKIDSIDETSATVSRAMEDGTDQLKLTLPACVSTVKEISTPRLALLKGKMAAKKAVFPKWGIADLGLQAAQVGGTGSTSVVVKASTPPSRPAGMKVEGATAAEKAKKLVDILFERKLI
jgi:electron transfer flavoprotein beta subunit